MSQARAQALLQQALAQHQAGRLPVAAKLYAQPRPLAPRSFEAHHLGEAAALQLNQPSEAEKLLSRAVALNQRSSTTYMSLGPAQAVRFGDALLACWATRSAAPLSPANVP